MNWMLWLRFISKFVLDKKYSPTLKGNSTQNWKFSHHLLTVMLSQINITYFLQINTNEDFYHKDLFTQSEHNGKLMFYTF